MTTYSINKQVASSFEDTVRQTKEALAREGFGVLSEINVRETLKKKLDVEYPEYVILGACHPQSAYQVLQEEKEIGLLLPCNVIVYEESDTVTVSAVRPTIAMQMVENSTLASIAEEVEKKLQKVMDSL